jgi:hypothetical protein
VLRLLHDAEPPRPLHGFQRWLDERITCWRHQAAPMLSAADLQIVDHHLAALRALGTPGGGPGHFDFQGQRLDRRGLTKAAVTTSFGCMSLAWCAYSARLPGDSFESSDDAYM